MRVREENCNMILLAAATLVCTFVALVANWSEGPQPPAAKPTVSAAIQTSVRLIGAPFIPNVNPRDRH